MIGIERINFKDNSNNGLLLRNLFSNWPKDHTAQVFSYNDNGDDGFFGSYFRVGKKERLLGFIFFKLKQHEIPKNTYDVGGLKRNKKAPNAIIYLKRLFKRLLIETGISELIFRPRISKEMKIWIDAFNPEYIFVQGYGLYYCWLALAIKKLTKAKLVFLTTDDWPTYLYAGVNGELRLFSWFVRPIVDRLMHKLISEVDTTFAFHQPMADEYKKRYNRKFITLSHADDPARFTTAIPKRYHDENTISIVVAGYFNGSRWPLLLDVNECCRRLTNEKIPTRILVIASGIEDEGRLAIEKAEYIDIIDDPGNDILPQYLNGANINLLIEDLDPVRSKAINLSVSSKSHLFMFSQRPIIVYAHANTGVARYAEEYGWAKVVNVRDISLLSNEIQLLITDKELQSKLIQKSKETYTQFHLKTENQALFLKGFGVT